MSDAPALDRARVQQSRPPDILAASIVSSVLAVISANVQDFITTWNPGIEQLSG
jgi:hypothetical protein